MIAKYINTSCFFGCLVMMNGLFGGDAQSEIITEEVFFEACLENLMRTNRIEVLRELLQDSQDNPIEYSEETKELMQELEDILLKKNKSYFSVYAGISYLKKCFV